MKRARAYYNDSEPYVAKWLRNLIADGHISAGIVDDRSIKSIVAADLVGFDRCHFFAGIGGWEYALNLAGWRPDEPVWSGSCPCPPFSVAGNKRCPLCGSKRRGFYSGPHSVIEAFGCFDCEYRDPRHLWPPFRSLIAERRPDCIFGEQVGSAAGREWLAGIQVDLEVLGYSFGAADLCAACVESPHARQRLFWVAYAKHRRGTARSTTGRWEARRSGAGTDCGLGNSNDERRQQQPESNGEQIRRLEVPRGSNIDGSGLDGGLGNAIQSRLERHAGNVADRDEPRRLDSQSCGSITAPSCARPWAAYELVECTDGKARRIEPGTFPLAHGVPARVGKLRAYGNAIVPQVAAEFIKAFLDAVEMV